MKLTHDLYKCFVLLMLAVMGSICFSCSEETPGAGGDDLRTEATVIFKVATNHPASPTRSLTSSGRAVTRDLVPFEGEPTDNELIHSCVVAFVESDGTVAEVKELAEETTGVVSREFSVILKEGNYKVYAFANPSLTQLSDLKLDKDTKINIEDVESALYDVNADELTIESQIPMSGYLSSVEVSANGGVKIDGSSTETKEVTITVVRMVGKIQFEFTNNSASDITLKEISFKPGATGAVKLLPTWNLTTEKPYTKLTPLTASDMTGATVGAEIMRTFTSGLTIPKKANNAEGGNGSGEGNDGGNGTGNNLNSCSLYVREVVSNHPTGSFPISIKYTVGEGATAKEEVMTALLYDLTQINRNDWILVPITLTDRKLTLDVEFYPPIGGYPPVTTAEKENEYYVTFATGGWFSIRTDVVEKADGSKVDPKSVEISIAENGVSNKAFFRKQPGVEASGELTGEIATGLSNGASSVVTITVKLTDKDDNNNPVTAETFTRKIHFIYQQSSGNN